MAQGSGREAVLVREVGPRDGLQNAKSVMPTAAKLAWIGAMVEAGIRETVAARIGKFARPKRIVWADDLPKTRSGKIMRRLLRDIAEGRALGDVTTLRDPGVMKELEVKIAEEADDES